MNKMFLGTCFALALIVDLKASENCQEYLTKADSFIQKADVSSKVKMFSAKMSDKHSGLATMYMMRYNICISKKQDRGHLTPSTIKGK